MLCLGEELWSWAEELSCGAVELWLGSVTEGRGLHSRPAVQRRVRSDWWVSAAQWLSVQSSHDALYGDPSHYPTPPHPRSPLPPALWLSWFHLENTERGGHGVIPWPHQISPNRVRCLARVKTSNLKGIKCKCDDHMPTSNTHGSHPAVLPLLPSRVHTAEPFTCITEWGAVKMTMGFCHADQVQNISTAGRVSSCLISVNRTFATRKSATELLFAFENRYLLHICIMSIHISFHPDLKLGIWK